MSRLLAPTRTVAKEDYLVIKVSVMYPNSEGHTFDMSYYLGNHMQPVRQELGAALKGLAVDEGIASATPGSRPAYLAIGHLVFESMGDGYSELHEHRAQGLAMHCEGALERFYDSDQRSEDLNLRNSQAQAHGRESTERGYPQTAVAEDHLRRMGPPDTCEI